MRRLDRRTFLRGAGGALLALPLLDIMLDDHGEALADGSALPCRYLVCGGGYSLGVDGDATPNGVLPSTVGPGYDLGPALLPLDGHNRVRDAISVVSNLTIPHGDPIPAGGMRNDEHFHWHMSAFLCGQRTVNAPFDATVTAPSSDQIVADAIGGDTLFKSLSYRVQPVKYAPLTFPAHINQNFMSFDAAGDPVQPAISPLQAYMTLFSSFVPDDPAQAAARALALAKRKSVLDLIDRRMDGKLAVLGASDRQRLEQHLEHVRHIEKVLSAQDPSTGNPACQMLGDPGQDPAIGGDNDPNGYDTSSGYSGEDHRAQIFCDLMHMAFVCDMTRVGTLMFTMWQSVMNIQAVSGHGVVQHGLFHPGANSLTSVAALNDLIAWHMDRFGYLVAKLRDTPEGAGSVLDNCAIAFVNEGGDGPGMNDPIGGALSIASHAPQNMCTLIAGGAGGLRQGEHIVAPNGNNHPASVLLTLMHAVGAQAPQLGEISGQIGELVT